jgi:spermidine dehydrogenase
LYSDVARGLLRDLGVDIGRFETAFDRNLYSSLGLSRGVFFAREAFGSDVLVPGDVMTRPADDPARVRGRKPREEVVAAFPLSQPSKAQLLALYDATRDPLSGPLRKSSGCSKPPVIATT